MTDLPDGNAAQRAASQRAAPHRDASPRNATLLFDWPIPQGIQRHEITSREQWLELRKPDVTASVGGALFGVHPYETLAGLYWQKRGIEMPAVDESSVLIRRGRLFEQAVADAVAEERPEWLIRKANGYYRDPRLRLGCTPDFFIDTGAPHGFGVLQTKVVTPAAFKKSWDETTPPFWITIQTTIEAMLTDADFAAIGALVVGDYKLDLHVYEIPRHKGAEQRIRNTVRDFWKSVEDGVEPKIDYERDGALLSILFPREQPGKTLDLTANNRMPTLLERREVLTREIKEQEAEKKLIDNEIREKIGDAESVITNGWSLTFREQKRAAYEVPANSFRVLRARRETFQ